MQLKYETYPENKFRLQMLLLQCCGYDNVNACKDCLSLGRHERHLQTIEQRLYIVLCVYNVQENLEAFLLRSELTYQRLCIVQYLLVM
jgi:hypothetical protein